MIKTDKDSAKNEKYVTLEEFRSFMVEMKNLVGKPGPNPWKYQEKSQEGAKEEETSIKLHEDILQKYQWTHSLRSF